MQSSVFLYLADALILAVFHEALGCLTKYVTVPKIARSYELNDMYSHIVTSL